MHLSSLGWDELLAQAFQPHAAAGFTPARVAIAHAHACELLSPEGPLVGECTGRLWQAAAAGAARPTVGDWVAIRVRPGEARADLHAVLPRRTTFSRRAPGGPAAEQVLAANVDTALLVTALDQNYNLRRIERLLAVAWASGAQPVVVLNKTDLHANPADACAEVRGVAGGAPVVALSALASPEPETVLAPWLLPGRTLAFLGSSGVGKSTLINRLLGAARQRTGGVSLAVGKGRHTTTHRELIPLASGALLLDTPGLREVQLWALPEDALDQTFSDIAALAARCRFHDCAHTSEPGCAVRAALEEGTLDPARWRSFQKLQREQAFAARQADSRLERENRARWKRINRDLRARNRWLQEAE